MLGEQHWREEAEILRQFEPEGFKPLRELVKPMPEYKPLREQDGRDWVDNSPQTVTSEWIEPVPFDEPELPKPLTANYLGGVYADYAKAAAQSVQVDVSLTVGAVLGAMSTATMGRWSVQINRDWVMPAPLYLGLVAISGEGKSPAINGAFAPLYAYENEKFNADKAANNFAKCDIELIEAEISRAKKEYVSAKGDKRELVQANIRGLQEQLSEAQPDGMRGITTISM